MGMIPVKCPECGADIELDDSREFGFCNYCGTKVMQDKVVVEHQGTVKIDNSDEISNLKQLAKRAKDNENYEKAEIYYEQILMKVPNDWEANYYVVYSQAMNCKIAGIMTSVNLVKKSIGTVIPLVKDLNDKELIYSALNEIMETTTDLVSIFYKSHKNYYDNIPASIKFDHTLEFVDCAKATVDLGFYLGDLIDAKFDDEYNDISVKCWKYTLSVDSDLIGFLGSQTRLLGQKSSQSNIHDKYVQKVKTKDPSYTPPQSSGCYVATAVYGSYDCPEVWTLRRYRDNQLAKTWYGRAFIHTYYAISPTLVKWFGDTQWFKNMWKPKLDSMVKELQESGVESTPYEDRKW